MKAILPSLNSRHVDEPAHLKTPSAISGTPTAFPVEARKAHWRRTLSAAALSATTLLSLLMICLPANSPITGRPSEITLALAWQDQPSGIYLDRQFDWPTGEAVWIDVPVRFLQLICIVTMLVSLVTHLRSKRAR